MTNEEYERLLKEQEKKTALIPPAYTPDPENITKSPMPDGYKMTIAEFNENDKVRKLGEDVFGYLSANNVLGEFAESKSYSEDIAEAMLDDFNLGVLRQIPFSDTSSFDFRDLYRFCRNRGDNITNQGQDILESPNVAGWPAYYQDPLYHEIWINAVTLPLRTSDISLYFRDSGINATSGEPGTPEDVRIYAEPIKLLDEIDTPDDIDFIIELFCKWFFPVYSEISEEQKEDFKNIVVGDNPNMWYDEYHEYINNPTDEGKTAINNKLKTLVKEMCLMPEYHLS